MLCLLMSSSLLAFADQAKVMNSALQLSESKQFQETLKKEREALSKVEIRNNRQFLNSGNQETYTPKLKSIKRDSHAKLLVFASFGIPAPELRSLIKEAVNQSLPVYFRGLHGGFKKGLIKLQKLAVETHGDLRIDPTLFEKYGIDRVPAYVVPGKNLPTFFGATNPDYVLELARKR